MKEIAPTGKLRVGVVEAPVATAFFVTKDAAGRPHGVTVDLAEELAAKLGVPVEFTIAPNSRRGHGGDEQRRARCFLHAGRRRTAEEARLRPVDRAGMQGEAVAPAGR